jgi:RHS repeat-associated protein
MGFDNAGRITEVTNQTTGLQYASAVTYAPNDVVSGVRLGNGLTESTTFNTRFQPTRIKAANLLTLALTYGSANNGNLASQTIVRASGTWMQTYNYDGVNRLVCANEVGGAASVTCGTGSPNWWLTFGYDGWGNHWLSNDPNGAGIPISPFTPKSQTDYDGSNHLLTDSALFDTAGNQKQIGGFQFGYDSENRLTSSVFTPTSASQTTAQYDYDGFGRRVRKTVNGQATTYVYDAAGQLAVEYGLTTDAGTNYLTADHLGSTRLITDATGSVARCYDYLPFGEEIANGTAGRTDPCFGSATYPAPQDIESTKFAGKERDSESGLDFFLTRYYSGAQGRFTSTDPLPWLHWQRAGDEDRANFQRFISDPQNFNLYAYARNNPLRFSDPTGMYYCTGSTEQCEQLKKAYVRAQTAMKSNDLTKDQKAAIQKVLTFLGNPGDVNGVVVKFENIGDKVSLAMTDTSRSPANTIITTITYDPSRVRGHDTASLAESFIHEGVHGVEGSARGHDPITPAEELSTERSAWGIESYIPMGLGVASRWGLWDPAWRPPQAEINRQKAIERAAQESARAACAVPGACK